MISEAKEIEADFLLKQHLPGHPQSASRQPRLLPCYGSMLLSDLRDLLFQLKGWEEEWGTLAWK